MGRTRYQEGSLRLESRKGGKVWRLRFRITRADGNRVEHAIVIGTQKELPTRAAAREFVKSLYLPINHPAPNNNGRPVTFSDIAGHYIQEELTEDQNQASVPKAFSTTTTYRRYLRKWVLPRWGNQPALLIQPLDLENWLKELGKRSGLQNQTRSKIRQVIGLVYKHAQRVGFLPRTEQANPIRFVRQSTASNFEPIILTPAQAFAIINQLGLMLRTLVLVTAATALRISEILALQWRDIDVQNQCIYVRRAYVYGKFGKPKSKASKRPVPLHPVLAAHLLNWRRETPYSKEEELVFPSFKLKGRKPPSEHAFVRSSSACSRQSRCCSAAPSIWVPHVPTDAGVGPGGEQLRSEAGARTTPPFEHQDHPGHLCPSHYVGQAGSAGDVPDRTAEGLMGREETGNELRCLAQTLVLWAYCGLAQIEGFRISALKCGGQGRS